MRYYLAVVVEGEGEVVVVFPVSGRLWWKWRLWKGVSILVGLFVNRLKLTTGRDARIYYPAERSWRRCGGGQGSACMSRKNDGNVARLDLRLALQCS